MVLLKLFALNRTYILYKSLHSTMVLLKQPPGRSLTGQKRTFTFHYGLIKTPDIRVLDIRASHFTFHYGLIKTEQVPPFLYL